MKEDEDYSDERSDPMGLLLDLYKLKLKVFFGSLKASKVSIILLLFYSLSMVPFIFGILTSSFNFLKEAADLTLYTNTLSVILAGLLALSLIPVYRGTTAFEYEHDFIFTSSITPRQFLVACLLADGTTSILFLYPLPIFVVILVFSLGLSVAATLMLFVSSLFFLFTLLLRSSLSILVAIYKNNWPKTVITTIIAALLLPATSIILHLPVDYDGLPYPTTYIARMILTSLSNKPSTVSLYGFSLYLIASLALFYLTSRRNFFQFVSPIPLISAFDTSLRTQTVKADMNIRLFSRVGLKIALTSDSKSLLKFLMKKEFIRILRDGSLFMTMMLYTIAAIISFFGSARGMPMPIWIFLLALYSFIVPPMLVSNWRVVELKSLWIPLTSGMNLSYLFRSMLYDFIIISSSVPVAVISLLTLVRGINPSLSLVLIISVSMIGCSVNLYAAMLFLSRRARAAPSMLIIWLSILLTGLLLSPVYTFVVISLLQNLNRWVSLALSGISLAYSTLIFLFFSKKMSKKALSLEL